MTTERTSPEPTNDQRRVAVTAAIAWGPRLIRYAVRYCQSTQDAEDAYQRAMEIALTRAPVVERRQLLAWLHVVVKHEALDIAANRRRERPADPDEMNAVPDHRPEADRIAEWHERHRQLRDGLGTLTESERVCVALKGAGLSYAEIADRTGFTPRKVERSLLEGRERLRRWELSLRAGGECTRLEGVLSAVAHGEANAIERRRASRHVGHCGPCRAEFRRMRARQVILVSLVPTGLLSQTALAAQPPDPSIAVGAVERIHTAANVRIGGLWQAILDAPGPLLAKAGATLGGAVVVSAAFVGGVNPPPPATKPIVLAGAVADPPRTLAKTIRRVAPAPPAAPAAAVRRRPRPQLGAVHRLSERPSPRTVTYTRAQPAARVSPPRLVRLQRPPASRQVATHRAAASEFGP